MRPLIPLFRGVCVLLALFSSLASAIGVYSSNVIISEFLASNSTGITDEDGSREDWIELYNPTPAAVNLNGWYLTDDAANLKKWKFPAVTLPSKGYLVVFASDKNRRNAGSPLHTNFKLSASGEFLGLIKPDGLTVAWQYTPTFPEQISNVSYGVTPLLGPEVSLIAPDAQAQFMVPQGSLPAGWTDAGFTPGAGWTSGLAGLGYDDTPITVGGGRILFVGNLNSNGTIPAGDQTVIDRLTTVLGHRVTYIDDNVVAAANATGMNLVIVSSTVSSTPVNTKLRDIAVPVLNWERGLTDDFLLSSAGSAVNGQTDLTVTTVGGTHPMMAGIPAGPVTVRQTAGTYNVASISNLAPGAKILATALTGEPAIMLVEKGQMLRSNTVAPANRAEIFLGDDGLAPLTPQGIALFDAAISVTMGAFTPTTAYDDYTRTYVRAAMKNNSATVLARFSFVPESVSAIDVLKMRIRYDDGFVAYLNGVEVARRNAPTTPAWNSTATVQRAYAAAVIPETIDLSAYAGLLIAGQPNVLAIQGLNIAADDINFLLQPELVTNEIQPFLQYYANPTPGALNDASTLGVVPETTFDVQRGYFSTPFQLTLANDMAEAKIRYTIDGSAPTATTGIAYTGPVTISTTTVVRAAAFRTGYSTGKPETRTYLKVADIIHQPASIPNWPQPTISVGTGSRIHDYEMDPEIVNDPAYTQDLIDSFAQIPTLCLSVARSDMWSSSGNNGFYRADDVKRPASVEYIDPRDPSAGVQADCSVEGHSHDRMKRSLRLSFSAAYGETKFESKLFTNSPLFPGVGNKSVDKIILRAGNNHSYARTWNPTRSTYTEDEWYRSTREAMGGPATPGTFVHLFIDGIYWGLYNPVERPDASFSANEYGGEKEDYFSVNHGGTHDGDATRWNYLIGDLTAKNMAVPANYAELNDYVDLPNFVDYLLCSFYSGMNDWPVNNWWGGNRNTPAKPFEFYNWDGETTWGAGNQANLTAWVHPLFRATENDQSAPATKIWHAARANPEFRMLIADRVYKHISAGGALSTEQSVARWNALAEWVRKPIVAESARWGDTIQEPPAKRDTDWQAEVNRVRNIMQTGTADGTGTTSNAIILRNAMRVQGFYPAIDPPVFSQEGGAVSSNFSLTMSNPNSGGTIYYTLDGTDPRLPGGAVHGAAVAYTTPVTFPYSLQVKARVLSGGVWSALNARSFGTNTLPPLRVTELMYAPTAPTESEIGDGFLDSSDFEFMEIRNHGTQNIDLTGAKFASGIDFTFGAKVIAPGETILLVHKTAAFISRYGSGFNIAGDFSGSLSNEGERIQLVNAAGDTLLDFTYSPTWYPAANGSGRSLVPQQPTGDPALWSTAEGWRASANIGGSPGAEDPEPAVGGVMSFAQWRTLHFNATEQADPLLSGPEADFDGDGKVNLIEYAIGTDPKLADACQVTLAGATLASRGTPATRANANDDGMVALYCQRKGGAGVGLHVRPVFSSDLVAWTESGGEPVVVADDGEIEVIAVAFPEQEGSIYFRLQVTQDP